ncbi:hypothetical protein FGIG_03787 [Fasciola gigantica]|uniref:UBC core domain-containing protein n=1 Tax=Fasciola gigantica TaxID=46835 RepID=A0A504YNX6_FASGI|nr:hypothetical protein FGIG_03787 [Fasciola gigantica]
MPKVETEFAGQIALSPLEEVNVGEVLVEITPSKGYYAQATFIFQIQATPNYPFQKPIVSCLTSIFHPNISDYIMEQNVCLNFLNNWSPRYGLKDLLHALLFLFYEPNFDDPWNRSAASPEDGLTMEETIRKSFHGGLINGVRYEPNTAWLLWSEKNASESAGHSPKKECLENSSNLLNGPTIQQQQQEQPATMNYFRETLSGQYASMIAASNDELNYYWRGQFTIEFAHICRIIVRSTASDMDSVMSVNNFRCYYNAEQCSNDQEERINTFNTLSVTAFTVERHQLEYGGQQSSVYRSWFLNPIQPLDDEPFSDEPRGDSPIFDVGSSENDDQMIDPDCDDAPSLEELREERSADEQEEPEQPEEPCARTVEIVDGFNTEDQSEVELLNRVLLVSESATNDAKPGISNDVPTTESQNDGEETVEKVLMAIGPSDSPTITANNADSIVGFVEDEWQGIENVDGERSETNSNMEDDELDYLPDANICREMFQSQGESARRLWPCWWILYQSRWPAYLAPHHMTKIRSIRHRYYFSRASSFVLRSDLFRLGSRCAKGSVFFLVDSLVSVIVIHDLILQLMDIGRFVGVNS